MSYVRKRNNDLLDIVLEEYEKNPTVSLELLLLDFANDSRLNTPLKLAQVAIPLIGKRLALIRAINMEKDAGSADDAWDMDLDNDDIEGQVDSVDMSQNEESLLEDGEIINQEGPKLERYELEHRTCWSDRAQDFSSADLMHLLATKILNQMDADFVKQLLPQLLEMVKTEFSK